MGIIVIAIPLLIYITAAISVRRKGLTHPDDFFVAYKKVGKTAFSSSSIAYAFQIGTIYPFLLWGASKFYFVPIVNTICWGLGIFLFYLSYNKYKHFIGKELTLHGFLGEQYGKNVRVVASWLTITAFLGFAIAETYFGSKVLLSIVEDKNLFYGIIVIAFVIVYSYISYGGQVSSIRTDQLQLIVAYLGVFGLLAYFLYLIISNDIAIPATLSWGLFIIAIYTVSVFLLRKLSFIKFNESDNSSDRFLNKMLNSLIIVVFSGVSLLSLYAFFTAKRLPIDSEHKFFNLEGFGIPGLLSLIILPLCFQFVDLSNWQRLLSVKEENDMDEKDINHNIRKGLLTYSFESPFTWLIFVFFGLLAVTALPHFTFVDLMVDIPKQLLNSDNHIQVAFGYVFIISIVSIMLSTIDSFIMGIIFTYVYDSNSTTRKLLDSRNDIEIRANYAQITNKGRLFGFIAILIGLTFFIFFDRHVENGGVLFINLLLAFYSAQLAFFPHIFGILFLRKHPSAFWASFSMIIAAFCGISVGVYAVLYKPEFAWYPILICISISTVIYVIGYLLKSNK